nr:linoleate 13S-lipoxygenase 2-1, chloroplastic-like [Tanacetum cinerariifolium]
MNCKSPDTTMRIKKYTFNLKEWPITSKLNFEVYGPSESAITKEIIDKQIRGWCTLDELQACILPPKMKSPASYNSNYNNNEENQKPPKI